MIKKQFALIGDPILHSVSPFVHKRLFELSKVFAEYNVINIKSENLEYSMPILNNLNGYNVTAPHKQNIIKLLDTVNCTAAMYNSVNTVKNDVSSVGYSTDGLGFTKALETSELPLGENILILGAGGVARVIAFEAAARNKNISIAVRQSSIQSAATLKANIESYFNDSKVSIFTMDNINGTFDLLVNATPVGTFPHVDESVVSEDIIVKCKSVFDTVYNPIETQLIKIAKANGLNAQGGLSMLIWQAVYSHKIWLDCEYDNNDIFNLIEDTKLEIMDRF